MKSRHLSGLRFSRTASEAFRDYTYGACIERPLPSTWQRLLQAIREILS